MSHTLVATFRETESVFMKNLCLKAGLDGVTKIPYGNQCDRLTADQIIPYHMTMFHWSGVNDEKYLKRVGKISFSRSEVEITGLGLWEGWGDSLVLALRVKPGEGYLRLAENVENAVEWENSKHLHVTLAIDKDQMKLREAYEILSSAPLEMTVLHIKALELFHIRDPVQKVRIFE